MKEAKGYWVLGLIGIILVGKLVWAMVLGTLFMSSEIYVSPVIAEEELEAMSSVPLDSLFLALLPVVFLFALAEELAFRSWLGLFRDWDSRWIAAVVSSVTFGALHGNWPHIIMQGSAGMVYAYIFLKCGGGQGNGPKGLLCSTAAHTAFNMICFLAAAAAIAAGAE